MTADSVLEIRDLCVAITQNERTIVPVDRVSLSVATGETLGIVGESGAGKSLTLKAIIGLLPSGAAVARGELLLRQDGILAPYRPTAARGKDIAMVFQEPMTALNPTKRVGDLIAGGPMRCLGMSRKDARERAVELMKEVGIPAAEQRATAWPHQLSGGLRQRVMIAMALSSGAQVVLCDEPTTALDVTVQDQILSLLDRLRADLGLAVVFVTHDLAVVGQVAQTVAVMYAGQIVEYGPTRELFDRPLHPYTEALLASIPTLDSVDGPLSAIGGTPPDPKAFPPGCRFSPRCPYVRPDCLTAEYRLDNHGGRWTACIHPDAISATPPPGARP